MASFDEAVPPGKAGTIRASVHTQNYRGAIYKTIAVAHNDPSQPAIELTIKARVVGSVDVFPYPSLALAARQKGFDTPARLLVRKDATETGTLALDGLGASSPWLHVEARKVTDEEPPAEGLPQAEPGDVVLSVQVADPPPGIHAESITFKTGLTREPVVTIPVHVTVRAPIVVNPPELVLTALPGPPARATGAAVVSVREDLDPAALTVSSTDPAFTVATEPSGPRGVRVTVTWTAAPGKDAEPAATDLTFRVGEATASLRVRVNLARLPEMAPKPAVGAASP